MIKVMFMVNMKKKERSIYLDFLKGLLIIMVVFAHSIQYGSGQSFYDNESYFSDPLFKWIYSFHMPLFMLISGYFFWGTVNRYSVGKVVSSRLRSLLLPIVVWQTLFLVCMLALGEIDFSLFLLYSYPGALWFLTSVLISSSIVLIGHVCFRSSLVYYIMVWIGLLFVPDNRLSGLHVFMYPYFFVGYLWNKWDCHQLYNALSNYIKWTLLLICILFNLFFYTFYDIPDYSVYLNGTTLLGRSSMSMQLWIDMMRYLYGLTGCILTMVAIDMMIESSWMFKFQGVLVRLGRCTLGIYIINHYANELLLCLPVSCNYFYLLTIAETVGMLSVCYFLVELFRQNRLSRYLLLGESSKAAKKFLA